MAALDSSRRARTVRVTGVVQGVGYRPFVYSLAHGLGVGGWVLNDAHGVLLEVHGEESVLDRLLAVLRQEAPPLARVDSVVVVSDVPAAKPAGGFEIRASDELGVASTFVAPDSHVCDDCLDEISTPGDRRYRYPFTNCTNCGPRYSIVKALPYDRSNTTMSAFRLCAECRAEYEDPENRRYHAEPIACPVCGPRLSLVDAERRLVATGDEALSLASAALTEGKTLAVKSIGGFHLAVDARDGEVVAQLRRKKRRDWKPFAVMVRSLADAKKIAQVGEVEATLLAAAPRPIVLLRKKPGSLPEEVAPRNPNIGVMLPSAPLHYLLLQDSGLDVLVMTSGNVSGYPIAHRNEDAEEQLTSLADFVLHNDRHIHQRVDDSVVRCSEHPGLGEPLITFFRRGRGYAPYAMPVPGITEPIVAVGAELKTAAAVGVRGMAYLSQHIGDLKNDEIFAFHQSAIEHLQLLYGIESRTVACDLHPSFRSHASAISQAQTRSVIAVQHHHAHMASCIVENAVDGAALGVIFDGAGYGTDGTTWGAEFLVGDLTEVRRTAHLKAIPLLGGDVAVREPVRTGLAMAVLALGDVETAVRSFPALGTLDQQQRKVFAAMATRGINSMPASSMGRFFDGVAALLGVCAFASYEAQGPIELEGLLGRDLALAEPYRFGLREIEGVVEFDSAPIVREMAVDVADGQSVEYISRRVHSSVTELVRQLAVEQCDRAGIEQVVLSGGVFLNEFLVVNTISALRASGLRVYSQRIVPPNDGGIALGQIAVAAALGHIGGGS